MTHSHHIIPIVLWISNSKASLSLVPTPSVPLTKTGFLKIGRSSKSKQPPKLPMVEAMPRFCPSYMFLNTFDRFIIISRFTPLAG